MPDTEAVAQMLRVRVIAAVSDHASAIRSADKSHDDHRAPDCPRTSAALDRLIAYERARAVFDHYNGPSRRAVGSTAWIAARTELDRLTESAKEPTP